jgi:predicted DNA-binding transcriptional regulator YafY
MSPATAEPQLGTIQQGRAGILAYAAQNALRVTIFYRHGGHLEMRTLTPDKLTPTNVSGYCHWRKARRTFRLDRIEGVML